MDAIHILLAQRSQTSKIEKAECKLKSFRSSQRPLNRNFHEGNHLKTKQRITSHMLNFYLPYNKHNSLVYLMDLNSFRVVAFQKANSKKRLGLESLIAFIVYGSRKLLYSHIKCPPNQRNLKQIRSQRRITGAHYQAMEIETGFNSVSPVSVYLLFTGFREVADGGSSPLEAIDFSAKLSRRHEGTPFESESLRNGLGLLHRNIGN
uniref:Uncharacterized protein n=1 Tax=Glossina pallidipes TaxID=7398 RepID=A0A1B0AEQ2_GLOPL